MEANAHYILENLKLQLDLQGKLLGLMKKKRLALADRQVDNLQTVLVEEQVVVSKIKHLAEVRNLMVQRFAGGFDVAGKNIHLKSIGESLQGQFRCAFEETLRGLSETARKIVELNTVGVRVVVPPAGSVGDILSSMISGNNSVESAEFGQKSQLTFPFTGEGGGGPAFDSNNGILLVLPHGGGLVGQLGEFASGEEEMPF